MEYIRRAVNAANFKRQNYEILADTDASNSNSGW